MSNTRSYFMAHTFKLMVISDVETWYHNSALSDWIRLTFCLGSFPFCYYQYELQ